MIDEQIYKELKEYLNSLVGILHRTYSERSLTEVRETAYLTFYSGTCPFFRPKYNKEEIIEVIKRYENDEEAFIF